MNCQKGLIFRQSCNCCDWPTTTTPATTTTTISVAFCSGKSDGIYANLNNPNSFYHCSNGLTHVQNCPANLVFRESCKCCDWPSSPADGFCTGKRNGNYANPNNPKSFYSCSNGLTYIMNCPADLIFWQSCNCCVYN